MPNRMTVVFDDPDLYRRVKIRAAEEGVPAKVIVERALREFFERDRKLREEIATMLGGTRTGPIDWEAWERWQAGVNRLDQELGPGPTDLSDVKKYLYPEFSESSEHSTPLDHSRVAEEPAEFDPR